MGAWKHLPDDRLSLLDQDERTITDLLQWKMLAQIAERRKRKIESENKNAAGTE